VSLGYLCRILPRKYLMSVLLPSYILRLRYMEANRAMRLRTDWILTALLNVSENHKDNSITRIKRDAIKSCETHRTLS
jgi:hypothetical protein